MQDVKDFLELKKQKCEERAEKMNEQIEMFKRGYETNEKAYGDNSINIDTNGREQYSNAISKQGELYAVVEFIEELQEKYFN